MNSIKISAFGKNDIRGIYGEDVNEDLFYYIGRGYVKFLCEKAKIDAKDVLVTVTSDVRHHSKSLTSALIKGITSIGGNVINLGVAPTPIGYFSEFIQFPYDVTLGKSVKGALIVTASHNPPQYNGLKLTYNKNTLSEEEIAYVKRLTLEQTTYKATYCKFGLCKEYDIIPKYIKKMTDIFCNVGKSVKIIVDSGNATGGLVAPTLYREIGCDVIELYSEPNGDFPNHHPNPSDEKTLDDLKKSVTENKADFGIAFDGDSDRIGVVDFDGKYLTGDKLLFIYANDIISDLVKRGEKPKIISEVKCSQVLFDTLNKKGAQTIMCKTGHGYIKSKMREKNAVLAGEMSGHIFFKDRYYGFDDAIYAGCRIIEIFAKHKKNDPKFKLSDQLVDFENVFCSPEVRYPVKNDNKDIILKKVEEKIENTNVFCDEIKDIIKLDGMRIVFEGGFALIRKSNTEPVFTLRFEARDENLCNMYKKSMIKLLDEFKESLEA